MAGRAVNRHPNLVLLGTTSLYSVGSSQYNRIRIPLRELGVSSDAEIQYTKLGKTAGYGSYHFSPETVQAIQNLLARRDGGGRRVNSIFGEGVSPRLRKIRDGLLVAGLPTKAMLKHGSSRIIYVVQLASNFREMLLGRNKHAEHLIPREDPSQATKKIINYWMRRWLAPRARRADQLESVAQHTHSYPVTHGARVQLPPDPEDLQEAFHF